MDTMSLVRQAIVGDSGIVDVIDDRCWCPRPDDGFDAEKNGPGVSFFTRGGFSHLEVKELEGPNVQVTAWAVTSEDARTLYSLLRGRLHQLDQLQLNGGFLMSCTEVGIGQDVVDPDTNWNTVVSFFQFWFRP